MLNLNKTIFKDPHFSGYKTQKYSEDVRRNLFAFEAFYSFSRGRRYEGVTSNLDGYPHFQ